VGAAERINQAYPKAGLPLSREIVRVAQAVGAHPFDLANLINFESAGTFSTSVQNRISGATGLIQFMPSTARGLGTSTAQLAKMSKVAQMRFVQTYLKRKTRIGPLNTVQSLFMAVFYPVAMKWPLDKEFSAKVQRSNPGIVTVGDYVAHALRRAKLPSSTEVGAAPLMAVPFSIAKRAAKAPTWALVTGAVTAALLLALLFRPRKRKAKTPQLP
jgi:hypothetical protein